MARTNNLSNFLTDVATAIKTKKGSETAIPAANFDTEILALPSQGVYQTKVVNIAQNGSTTVFPDSGYDAIEGLEIIVAVPGTPLQTKTVQITSNGNITILPDTGYGGFTQVDLQVAVPGQTINNQDKTITQNGTYQADSGYTGIGTATVNVHETTKVFSSVEQMRLNTDINLNDMAVIYDSVGRQYGLASGEWTYSLYIPATITFPDEIPESGIECDFETEREDGGGGSGPVCVYQEQFDIFIHGQGEELTISYSSQDNITYTCDSVRIENWYGEEGEMTWDSTTRIATFGTTKLRYNITNGYNDYFALLFRVIKPEYKGLYKVLPKKDTTVGGYYAQSVTDLLNGDYDEEYAPAYLGISVNTIQSNFSNGAVGLSTGTTNYGGYDDLTFGTVYIASGGMGSSSIYTAIYEDDDTVRLGFYANVSNSNLSAKYKIRYKTLSNGEITSVTDSKSINECIYSLISGNSYHVFIEMLSVNKNSADIDNLYLLRAFYPRILTNSGGTISVNNSVYISAQIQDYLLYNAYQQCPVQFNLNNPNQLLPGIIGYGPNIQVEGDGSIYQNLDRNKVYADIFNVGGVNIFYQTPQSYITNYNTLDKIQFVKKSTELIDYNGYIATPSITAQRTCVPMENYSLIRWGYNKTNNYNISIQCKTDTSSGYDFRFVVQNADTNAVIYNIQVDTVNQGFYTYIQNYDGNYIYINREYQTSGTYYSYIKCISLLNGSVTTVLNRSSSYQTRETFIVADNRYLAYSYNTQTSSSASKITCNIVDLTNNTSTNLYTNYSYNFTWTDYANIKLVSTDSNIYVYTSVGYNQSSRLDKFVKSTKAVTNLFTNGYVNQYTDSVSSNGYEDTTYVYFGPRCINKSDGRQAIEQMSQKLILKKSNDEIIFSQDLIKYDVKFYKYGNDLYLYCSNTLYYLTGITTTYDSNTGYTTTTCITTKVYKIPLEWYTSEDIYTRTIFTFTPDSFPTLQDTSANSYNLDIITNSITYNLDCIKCESSTYEDFDYSIIYNGQDCIIQKKL